MARIGKVEPSGRPVIWTSLKLGPDLTGHPSGSTFPIFTMTPWKILFICFIALNASLCSSLEHVLAFKMCSMKNICVQVLHTGSVQYYRTRSRCSISVALLVFKLCSIKEWVSFFLGSWGMNRSAGQTNRVNREAVLGWFVCSALRFIPHEPRKKDTHSLYLQCFQQRHFLKFSEKS